ncbi:MAG: ATP-binding protein [Myxococcota bacterium]
MQALNELVIVLSAPLLVVFILLTAHVRRFGAIHWVFAYLASWIAGFVDEHGPGLQPLVVWLGTLATLLFATGANAYGGGRLGVRQWIGVLCLPFGLGLLAATTSTSLGYAGMAVSDFALFVFAAWRTWPRGDLRALVTARALPFAFLLFVPTTLYYQISASLGHDRGWPTVVIATGMISLAAVQLLALTARMVRDQTLIRQQLEARLASQAGELEESRARARSAERLAAVGTLAAGIAHQINNPIGAILAAVQFELSDEKSVSALPGGVRGTLETIEREALRCGRIVRSVLLFARTDPGQVADHDLNAIVEASWLATADHARRRGACVELALSPEPVEVRGNAVELEQVVVNLIRNAVESRSGGVTVEVRVGTSDGRAMLVVRDDGPGLGDEARKRLFEPFYTTKLREGGSGLGLSVAHGILRTHGGEIAVDSEAGAGATFRVFLPLRSAAG